VFCKARARKKKGFFDSVEIIPFSGQTLRLASGKTVAKPSEAQERAAMSFKKEAKVLHVPTGNLQTRHISITEMQNQEKENAQPSSEDLANRPKNPFTLDDLKMYARQFAFKIKAEQLDGAETISSSLTKRDPKMPEMGKIHFELDNAIQLSIMQSQFAPLLVDFLRNKLQNWAIDVEFTINETPNEETNKMLTGKDKFNILAERNVNLVTLQKTFNLDLDF
jgi:hypothetical protein